jgi:hypothetical protein
MAGDPDDPEIRLPFNAHQAQRTLVTSSIWQLIEEAGEVGASVE